MRIVIASLHFNAGHTAHLQAYAELAKACGFEAALYLNKKYLDLFDNINWKILLTKDELRSFAPNIIWIYNIGTENIKLIRTAKTLGSKIVYVLHEPYMGISELLKEKDRILKSTIASMVNAYICSQSDRIILSSERAKENCMTYMKGAYSKSMMFPLIFPDQYVEEPKRKYFSMIGAYCEAHNSNEFLQFVKSSFERNDIFFQVATRSEISTKLADPVLKEMIAEGRLFVQQGRPLTEKEMNEAYRKSVCTWNVYKRSTQSGVLAHSFMQGTPVIAAHLGSFDEYITDGKNGTFVDDSKYDSIYSAYKRIEANEKDMTSNCRQFFLDNFYCSNQKAKFIEIINSL